MKSRLNGVSADLIEYLVEKRKLSQSEIAEILNVNKSFISRARKAERELSPAQMAQIADALGVPLGAMLLDSNAPRKNLSKEKREIVKLCRKLMHQADGVIEALRAEHPSRARRAG